MKKLRVAIVHDFFLKMGGAERVVKSMLKAYPQADVFTLVYDPRLVAREFPKTKFTGSGLQSWPGFIRRRYRFFFPYLRRAVERWDFANYDLVISSSSAFAHGVITNLQTRHVCYYHSPTRYLWDWHFNYLRELNLPSLLRMFVQKLLGRQRVWDYLAAQRPELVLANSEHIQKRIVKFYRRQAEVVYPPVVVDRFAVSSKQEGYYLFIGTLSAYKNVELAVDFFNQIGHEFRIIGDGKEFEPLSMRAKDNVKLLGALSDDEVTEQLQNCKALIFPGEEDFGIVMVEAMACGKPVFAYGKGGALEIVKPGKTGWLFAKNNLLSFEREFKNFLRHYRKFKPKQIREWAESFSEQKFIRRLRKQVHQLLESQD